MHRATNQCATQLDIDTRNCRLVVIKFRGAYMGAGRRPSSKVTTDRIRRFFFPIIPQVSFWGTMKKYIYIYITVKRISRWWQLKYFRFHPYLGKMSNLTHIFQMRGSTTNQIWPKKSGFTPFSMELPFNEPAKTQPLHSLKLTACSL